MIWGVTENDGEMDLYFVHLLVLCYKDKKF